MYINHKYCIDENIIKESISLLTQMLNRVEALQSKLISKNGAVIGNESLKRHSYNGSLYFGVCHKNEDGVWKESYISRNDKRYPLFVKKKYYTALIKVLNRCIRTLFKIDDLQAFSKLRSIIDEVSCEQQSGIPDFLLNTRTVAEMWADARYYKSDYHSETLQYKTDKGDMVRSKAELFIANVLYELHLPYRYECALDLNSGKTIFPDFTIMDPETGKLYYLEYFGLMDFPEYVSDNIKRISDYAQNGIVIGSNLLAIFEHSDAPFDPSAIRKMLTSVFDIPI